MADQHKLLVDIQKQLVLLRSDDHNKRYDACEELRILPSLPDFALEALREATQDPNNDVADAARRALDMHTYESEVAQVETTSTDSFSHQAKDVANLYKSIRSWAIWLVIIGGTSMVAGETLDPVWGIMLIVVGAMSWKIKVPAMFVIYSVIMAWAAVGNALIVISGGSVWWLVLSAFQVYLVFIIVKNYRKFRKLPLQELYDDGSWPDDLDPPQNESRIIERFAIVGLILSVISIILMFFTFMGCVMTLMMFEEANRLVEILIWVGTGAVDVAVLALGLGGAAVLFKKRRSGVAIAGMVMSGLVLVGYVLFNIVMLLIDEVPSEGLTTIESTARCILNL